MGLAYGGAIVRDGLVLALDAADRNSYPGSGTTWYDLSGNGNNASLQNGASFSTSNGGYISLDGTDDRIAITDSNGDFDFGTGDFSINVWLNQGTDTTYPHLYTLDDQSNFTLKAIRGGLDNAYRLYVYHGYSVIFTNSYLTPGTWQMVTLTRNGQEHKLYLDGTISDTVTDGSGPKSISGSTVYLGWGWASEYTPQSRGPVTVYNRLLSPTEVLQNYNATKGRFGL